MSWLTLSSAVLLMELLVVEAWLFTMAAISGDPLERVPVPFPLVVLTLLGFWAVAALVRPRLRFGSLYVGVLIGIPLLAVLLRVSPAGYGDVPGGPLDLTWLNILGKETALGSQHFGNVIALIILFCYLIWRGLAAGISRPLIEGIHQRLKYGMVALILAGVAATTVSAQVKPALLGVLGLILPIFVFIGLMASALGRVERERRFRRGDTPYVSRTGAWVRWSVLLSAGMVGGTLLLGVVFGFSSFEAALSHLGPVGAALDTIIHAIVEGWARLLGFLFTGPIEALKANYPTPTPPPVVTPKPGTGTPRPSLAPQWVDIIFAILQVLIVLIVVVVVVVILIALGRMLARQWLQMADHVPGEEREALDGGALLRQQLRGLLGNLRRSGTGGARSDTLARGSVRWLFREVLRAGAAAGVPRRGGETADEYAQRLAGLPGTPAVPAPDPDDLSALAGAYDEARYDGHEAPSAERAQLGGRASQVAAWLNRWGRGR
jgi:hypothetical protein